MVRSYITYGYKNMAIRYINFWLNTQYLFVIHHIRYSIFPFYFPCANFRMLFSNTFYLKPSNYYISKR